MAGYKQGLVPDDLWHLTIDDLLTPPVAGQRFDEPGPFVINLSTSSAPLSVPPKKMATWDQLHVYQVQREEGGRRRFRLRLGPISSELEADAILASVREHYPAAFMATPDQDDLRAITTATGKGVAQRAPNSAAQGPKDGAVGGVARPAPSIPQLKAVDAPVNGHELLTSSAAAPVTNGARQVTIERPPPAATATVMSAARQLHSDPLPAFDSTDTLRPLTAADLAKDQLTKWFAIQLAVGKDAFRPEDVLSLDLFKEFNLYSTTALDQGRPLHALRLGFFLEEAAARVIAEYLRSYFDAPTVTRVSASEHERFAEGLVAARKRSGETGIHEVVELSSSPPAPLTTLADLARVTTQPDPSNSSFRQPPISPQKR